jgi:antitoxin HicB
MTDRVFDYAVTVLPLERDLGGGYCAYVPDLPGCISDGETPQEAFDNAQDAIASWIEAAQEMGRTIPKPSTPDRIFSFKAAG